MTHGRFRSVVCLAGLILAAGAGLSFFGCTKQPEPTDPAPVQAIKTTPKPKEPKYLLDKEQRQLLWEIEHHGNVLNKFGFQALADAVRKADAEALAKLLAPDFKGEVLSQPRVVRLDTEFAQVERKQDDGHPPASLDQAGFIAELLKYRQPFTKEPKVKINLMTLSPKVRADLNSPWQGTCLFRMCGEAGDGKPREVVLRLNYRLPRPSEETLRRGGWMEACGITQSQEATAPRFLLREATAERGLDPQLFHDNWKANTIETNSGGVYLCDFDRDGILDVLITDLKNGYTLYKGLPDGKFKDVSSEMGLPKFSYNGSLLALTAAFVDLDGDGWEDLILGDRLFRNEGGKKFVEVTHRSNLRLPRDAGAYIVADYDRDGRMDLYVTRAGVPKGGSWIEGKSGDPKGNQLWRNLGNWQFENVTEKSGTDGGQRSTFSAVWLDADNDGWPDLYVINEFGNGVLYVNQHDGTFRPHYLASGASDFGSMGLTCGDIDNDGNIDLYAANMYSKAGSRVIGNLRSDTYPDDIMAKLRSFVAGSQLWRNKGGLQFEPMAAKWQLADVGWAYGAALVDLDNDGWLDLYATCGYISKSRTEPDG
jgi:hypothetical protein